MLRPPPTYLSWLYEQFWSNFWSVVVITETVPGIAVACTVSRLREGEGERAEMLYFHLFNVHPRSEEGRELLWFIWLLYDFCSILKLPLLSARTIFYMFSFVKHCNKTQLTLHGGIMKGSNNGNAQRTFTLPLHHSPAWPSARSGQFYQPFNGSD